MQANYVAKAVRLNIKDPTDHGWREDGSTEWEESCFSTNFKNVFSNNENLEINDDVSH